MKILLTHRFLFGNTSAQGSWAYAIVNKTNSLSQFENKLQKLAFPKNPDDLNGHDPLVVLGDGWELLCECILRLHGFNPQVGFSDITVCSPGMIGVDFEGICLDGNPGTVQSKYKGAAHAWSTELKESENMKLERFTNQSMYKFDVDPEGANMLIMTNAKGLHYWTKDNLLPTGVRCLGRPQIEYLINNQGFWNKFRELVTQANPLVGF